MLCVQPVLASTKVPAHSGSKRATLHLLKNIADFPTDGLKGNLSLLEILCLKHRLGHYKAGERDVTAGRALSPQD